MEELRQHQEVVIEEMRRQHRQEMEELRQKNQDDMALVLARLSAIESQRPPASSSLPVHQDYDEEEDEDED
jgi:hypothetical protein